MPEAGCGADPRRRWGPAGLARRAFVTPQTMNQVLRELEQKGWAARHPDPGHARILQADLTPAGHEKLRACHRAVNAVEEQMLAPLAPPISSSSPQCCEPASKRSHEDP
jgi:DNA-binding MarR family transcriptional regulator